MPVERFSPDHPLWSAYQDHLVHEDIARWVIAHNGRPFPGVHFWGVVEGSAVIGHISLLVQDIVSQATPVKRNGITLRETFVQTFSVDERYRRRGHGKALQLAALALTKGLGCYQMRSWSSWDKPANYALKLSLGFAVHPAIYKTESEQEISGVYFIKVV